MTVPPITSIISFVSSESDDKCDSVAQLDRAFDYESKGRRFESCRGHQLKISTAEYAVFFYALQQNNIKAKNSIYCKAIDKNCGG